MISWDRIVSFLSSCPGTCMFVFPFYLILFIFLYPQFIQRPASLSQGLVWNRSEDSTTEPLFYGDLWKVLYFIFFMFSFPSWGRLKITCRWATPFRAKFYLCSLLHYLLHFQKVLQLMLKFLIICFWICNFPELFYRPI